MKNKGNIETICGPMFSGKTEELIRRLKRSIIARNKVVVFKPKIEIRNNNCLACATYCTIVKKALHQNREKL